MKPMNNKVKLDIKDVLVAGIPSGNIEERGIILDVADDCVNLGVMSLEGTSIDDAIKIQRKEKIIGKTLYFKAWAVDIITIGEEKHYFISSDSDGICAISD